MGDWTQMQVMIYACPLGQVRAVCAVLRDHGLREGWDGPEVPEDRLILGENYSMRSSAGDYSEEVATALIEAAPGCAFRSWTDPAYEWLGSLVMHVPELGAHAANCDSDGQAQYSYQELRPALIREPLNLIIGTAWEEWFLAHPIAELKEVEAPRCDLDGHRPDDDPEPGDRCKDCGRAITWTGPSMYDWELAYDPEEEGA